GVFVFAARDGDPRAVRRRALHRRCFLMRRASIALVVCALPALAAGCGLIIGNTDREVGDAGADGGDLDAPGEAQKDADTAHDAMGDEATTALDVTAEDGAVADSIDSAIGDSAIDSAIADSTTDSATADSATDSAIADSATDSAT